VVYLDGIMMIILTHGVHLIQGLGLGIVAGSCLVKLPQILKLVSSQSAQGLNPVSFEIETFCATVAATYGFVNQLSFNAFGEAVVRSCMHHV
jgi:mannose-P-dolichol utilization defect 1